MSKRSFLDFISYLCFFSSVEKNSKRHNSKIKDDWLIETNSFLTEWHKNNQLVNFN